MILNVSGRTDVVAFYSQWFMNRYKEGFLDVRNPFNPKFVNRIYFKDVDAILFCTKNPIPLLDYISEIDKPVIIHVTITSYKDDIEPNVPSKVNVIEAVKKLSRIVGIDNVIVRYDPVFLSEKYNLEYHVRAFDKLCLLLKGSVNKVIISFIDDYKNVRNNKAILNAWELKEEDFKQIGLSFSESAKKCGMNVQTCFEDRNLVEYGFVKGDCLSVEKAFRLTGKIYKKWQARKGKKCNCAQMVDIGVYNTCKHFCKYCYANYDEDRVRENSDKHNPDSTLLIGELKEDDIIKIRE